MKMSSALEARVNLHLSNLVVREKTEAPLLCPALHKSLLYVDKVSGSAWPLRNAARPAVFTRPPGGSRNQPSSLLITLDYFHLPGSARHSDKERGREKK